MIMLYRSSTTMTALAVALTITVVGARAADEVKYPNWKGLWAAVNPPLRPNSQIIKFDPTKASGPAQQAPLTPEYQKVLEESMADQANGGLGNYPTARCLPGGMPRVMASPRLEYVITPEITYILGGAGNIENRRIFTDGRDWPKEGEIDPSYIGYSIGRWIDEDGDGRYDLLEVETRNFSGPRVFESSGLPLHADNQTVVKERIYLDRNDKDVLHDEITTIDHALTRPWTVDRTYLREPIPYWMEKNCYEANQHVTIGAEEYFLSGDGKLMPVRAGQPPPDLRHFKVPPRGP
jgi:hypothetical protein